MRHSFASRRLARPDHDAWNDNLRVEVDANHEAVCHLSHVGWIIYFANFAKGSQLASRCHSYSVPSAIRKAVFSPWSL